MGEKLVALGTSLVLRWETYKPFGTGAGHLNSRTLYVKFEYFVNQKR